MFPDFERKVSLCNKSDQLVEMKEHRFDAPTDYYHQTIPIVDQVVIPATMFRQNSEDSGRPITVKLFLGGKDTGKALIPQEFIDHVQIIFRVNERGELTVSGIPATLMEQLSSISLFGFLHSGDYTGRVEEILA